MLVTVLKIFSKPSGKQTGNIASLQTAALIKWDTTKGLLFRLLPIFLPILPITTSLSIKWKNYFSTFEKCFL